MPNSARVVACVCPCSASTLRKARRNSRRVWPYKLLRESYPFVLPNKPEENRLYFRAMLLHFRQILDDRAFAELCARPLTPALLQNLAHEYRQAIATYYEAQAQSLAAECVGQRVYFWGHGAAWRSYGKYFQDARPVCFLVDHTNCQETEVDGIPVRSPDDLLAENAPALPGIMFVREEYASWAETVRAKYGKLISGDMRLAMLGQVVFG